MTQRNRTTRAFTLVEVVLALGITVILLAAAQSLVFLTAKSIPSNRTAGYVGVTSAIALDVLEADLRSATMVTVASATVLEMRVPDRDNDGLQETIRYDWSGTSGAPLQRKVMLSSNGQTATEQLIASLATMSFTHDLLPASAFRSNEVPETLIASFEPPPETLTPNPIASNAAICQTMAIVLPPTASSYKITRVAFRMSTNGAATGVTLVSVNQPLLNLVSLLSMATTTIPESSLTNSTTWVDVAVPSSPSIGANSATALTLKVSSGGPSAYADVYAPGAPSAAGGMTRTNNGLLWASSPGNALAYRVYGTFATPSAPNGATAPRYAGCTLKFTVPGSAGQASEVSFRCPNQPEAP